MFKLKLVGLDTFWCGWRVPHAIPFEQMNEKWPEGMKGWFTGQGDTYDTYAGRVDATSPEEAEAIIRQCYGTGGAEVTMRWEPEPRGHGYRNPNGRFLEG